MRRAGRASADWALAWTCARCGGRYDALPLCFGAAPPWPALVPAEEFDSRVELNADLCVVDASVFFVRGHVDLPILGTDEVFSWSVWCSLSEASFGDAMDRWHDPERVGDAYFGWLCSSISVYPSTVHLKTIVRSRAVGRVPSIELQECEHPLYAEQREGVTVDRVREIAHLLLHSDA
ncbi:MAG: DUF2199 domain-containing protein [Labilithrix sp.]|nr:DUF2199 domain-containing protein [Labilithrix sp.]